MVNETSPEPLFRVSGAEIPRTFYFKLTEQNRREKLAVGGFEPEIWFKSAYLHHNENVLCLPRQRTFFHAHRGKTWESIPKMSKNELRSGQNGCFIARLLHFGTK